MPTTKKKAAGKAKGPAKKRAPKKATEKAVKDLVDQTKARGEAKRTNEYQEESPKDKPKRAQTEVHIVCPTCKDRLIVKTFRNIVTPAVAAEVELETVVERDPQARLFTDDEVSPPGAETKVEPEEKIVPGGGRKKAD